MAIPIYESRPYSNPGRTARMSDLMRTEAAIRAQTELAQADASAQMARGIGNSVADLATTWAQYKMDEPRRQEQQRRADELRQKSSDDAAVKDVLRKSVDPETGKLDPKTAAREIAVIDPERARTWWQAASEEDRAKLALQKQQTEEIAKTAGALLKLPGPMRDVEYARVRQDVIESGLAKPEEVPETYDEGWLRTTRDRALTIAQQADEFHREATRSETERHNKAMEENARREKTTDPAKAGTFEDYLGRLAREKGKTAADLTPKEITAARQDYETAGRAPDKPDKPPTPDQVSFAQKAAAERWKQDALRTVEKEFRDSREMALNPMSTEELEARKQDIQRSYEEQIGVKPAPLPNRPEDQGPPQTLPAPPTPPAPPQAVREGGPQVGQVVSVRGQRVRITNVFPDGTFDAEPVP